MSNKAINWAYNQKLDNPLKKFVLVTLADGADQHGYIWKYYSTIAEMCDMARRTVINHVKALEDEGYLIKEVRQTNGFYQANIYRLNIGVPVPKDHPLKIYCKNPINSGGAQDALGGAQDALGGAQDALIKEPLLNPPLTKDKYIPLTRDSFLREIDKDFKGGQFDDFNLTESEIKIQAEHCWDFLITELKTPREGAGSAYLRRWLRNGIAKKRIKPMQEEKGAQQGKSVLKEPDHPEDQWQLALKARLSDAEYRAWIRPLKAQGVDIVAPSRFFADHVRQNYAAAISEVIMFNTITHNQQKETVNA